MPDHKPLLLVVGFLFLSCKTQPHIDINGTWLITGLTFQGQPTYPNTTNRGITDVLQGFEDYETLSFRIVDSTVVLPGFSTEKLTTDFMFKNNQLIILRYDENPGAELTNLIFSGTYQVIYSEDEEVLELNSGQTKMTLIHKDKALKESIDQLFD